MFERKIATERTAYVCTSWYYLVGPLGAVQYMFMRDPRGIIPIDLSVHSRHPLFEDQMAMDNCDILGDRCYYTGSFHLAQELAQRFIKYPDPQQLWQELESYYGTVFSF